MLARVRACERPRYGFYLDHVVDAFGVIAVLAGVAASGLLEPVLALALLVAYLLLQVHIALKAHAQGVFQIAFGGIGGTELRILVGLLNLLVWWRLPLSGGASATFEATAGLALAGLVLVTLADVVRTTGELWRRERLPAPPRDSAMGASAAWSSTRERRGGQVKSRFVSGLAVLLLALTSVGALAEEVAPPPPRVELGITASGLVVGGWGWAAGFAGGRLSLPLTRRLALDGSVDLGLSGLGGFGLVRAQARLAEAQQRQGPTWFGTAGIALPVCSSCGGGDGGLVAWPTVGVGLQKVLGSGIALRAELTANFYGLAPIWMPSLSVSVPLGKQARLP
jgi:phosphatidylglycerophosphate synthase